MSNYSIVQNFSSLGDNQMELLFLYHNEVEKDYLEKFFKLISSQSKDELIDLLIKQTESINTLYWMTNLFSYLDRVLRVTSYKGTLNKYEMIYINKYI